MVNKHPAAAQEQGILCEPFEVLYGGTNRKKVLFLPAPLIHRFQFVKLMWLLINRFVNEEFSFKNLIYTATFWLYRNFSRVIWNFHRPIVKCRIGKFWNENFLFQHEANHDRRSHFFSSNSSRIKHHNVVVNRSALFQSIRMKNHGRRD